jgi:hypothetical protein
MSGQGGVVLNWEATGSAGPSVLFETSADNAELIKEFGTAAALPIGDSALAALYQAGNQNTDFTMFRQAGYLGLNFALMDGTAAYHNSVDTAERLDKAGLQHMARTRSALPEASVIVIVQARRLGSLIWYPMWSVWPLVGLAIAIMVVLGVLARQPLAWYLTLRRWIGATALAIGALLWPAILGLVTAWLLLAMSYYGSLAVIGAAGGA